MAVEINYLKEAFKRQENVISLIGFGIAGAVFSSGFLLIGGALEISYLWLISSNPRFQRLVRAEKNQALSASTLNERDQLLKALPTADRVRYSSLLDVRQKVYDSWQARDEVTQNILQPNVEKLDYLLGMFLRAQVTSNRIKNHLTDSGRAQIEKQIHDLEMNMKIPMPDKLKEVKAKNIEILKQRVARLNKLQEDKDVVETQLSTLENAIRFMGDQSVALTDPRQISEQVDHLVNDVQETEKSISDVEVFLEAQSELKEKSEMAMQSQKGQRGE